MPPPSLDIKLDEILEKDRRYPREAYAFVMQSLAFTQKKAGEERKHITGRELLEGIREYAILDFDSATLEVLRGWGIHSCRDFGEIVFNMVDHGLIAKTDSDSRQDFENGFDFSEAFPKPFFKSKTFWIVLMLVILVTILLLCVKL